MKLIDEAELEQLRRDAAPMRRLRERAAARGTVQQHFFPDIAETTDIPGLARLDLRVTFFCADERHVNRKLPDGVKLLIVRDVQPSDLRSSAFICG